MGCAGKPTVQINNFTEEQQVRSIWIFGALDESISEYLQTMSRKFWTSSKRIKPLKVNLTAVVYWLIDALVVQPANHNKDLFPYPGFSVKTSRNNPHVGGKKVLRQQNERNKHNCSCHSISAVHQSERLSGHNERFNYRRCSSGACDTMYIRVLRNGCEEMFGGAEDRVPTVGTVLHQGAHGLTGACHGGMMYLYGYRHDSRNKRLSVPGHNFQSNIKCKPHSYLSALWIT